MINPVNTFNHNEIQMTLPESETPTHSDPLTKAIDYLKNLPIDEKRETDLEIPSFIDWAEGGSRLLLHYHTRTLKQISCWSHNAKNGVSLACNYCLYPLKFCKVGRIIQHTISFSILGNVAQAITFCTLQVFHLIPYIIISAMTAGTLTLYRTDPIALTSIFTGGVLVTQLWFIFILVKTVNATKKTFEQKADEFITAINLVQLIKNTAWSISNLGLHAIRFSARLASSAGSGLYHQLYGAAPTA